MKARVSPFAIAICPKCNSNSTFTRKSEALPNDITHTFYECNSCGYKATIMYTNPEVEKLLKRQRSYFLKNDKQSEKLAKEIDEKEQLLRDITP